VGFTIASRGEVPGKRKPVIRAHDDDDDDDDDDNNTTQKELNNSDFSARRSIRNTRGLAERTSYDRRTTGS
jgi:hypothetical protein